MECPDDGAVNGAFVTEYRSTSVSRVTFVMYTSVCDSGDTSMSSQLTDEADVFRMSALCGTTHELSKRCSGRPWLKTDVNFKL